MDLYIKNIVLIDEVEKEVFLKTNDPAVVEQLNSELSSAKSFFFQTIQDNTTVTDLPVVDQYESIAGARTEHQIKDFVVDGNSMKYTGLNDKKILINGSSTWEAGSTLNAHYKMAIFVNSVKIAKVEGTLDNSNAWPRNVSFNAIVDVSTDDKIEVMTANETNDQSVLIIDLLICASSI